MNTPKYQNAVVAWKMRLYNFTRTSRESLPHPRLGSRCLTIAATLKSVLLAERTQSYKGKSAAETQVPPKVPKDCGE